MINSGGLFLIFGSIIFIVICWLILIQTIKVICSSVGGM